MRGGEGGFARGEGGEVGGGGGGGGGGGFGLAADSAWRVEARADSCASGV